MKSYGSPENRTQDQSVKSQRSIDENPCSVRGRAGVVQEKCKTGRVAPHIVPPNRPSHEVPKV